MEYEVILPRRVVPQPLPPINAGGDCAACTLAGLTKMAVEGVYHRYFEKREAPCWHEVVGILRQMWLDNRIDRLITSVPYWSERTNANRTFGDTAILQGRDWYKYVTMALDAGYYGLVNYNMEGKGLGHFPDHYAMLVGVRSEHIPIQSTSGYTTETSVLISCSSTKTPPETWYTLKDFLMNYGGFNIMLARPSLESSEATESG